MGTSFPNITKRWDQSGLDPEFVLFWTNVDTIMSEIFLTKWQTAEMSIRFKKKI